MTFPIPLMITSPTDKLRHQIEAMRDMVQIDLLSGREGVAHLAGFLLRLIELVADQETRLQLLEGRKGGDA